MPENPIMNFKVYKTDILAEIKNLISPEIVVGRFMDYYGKGILPKLFKCMNSFNDLESSNK